MANEGQEDVIQFIVNYYTNGLETAEAAPPGFCGDMNRGEVMDKLALHHMPYAYIVHRNLRRHRRRRRRNRRREMAALVSSMWFINII